MKNLMRFINFVRSFFKKPEPLDPIRELRRQANLYSKNGIRLVEQKKSKRS